ncbi:hypothetical protein QO179_25060 [Bacillus stercoris]|nr:hypothetical protein [Bacillus stercoris]
MSMQMKIKFFQGTLDQITDEFNDWSRNKYISDSSIAYMGNGGNAAILKVIYGDIDISNNNRRRRSNII